MRIKIKSISRPCYPKSNIYSSLRNCSVGLRLPSPIGFHFTVDYVIPPGRRVKTMRLRDIDSIYFEAPYGQAAQQHLGLIIRARQGDSQARARLRRRIEEDRIHYARYDPARLDLGELSQYLVPSTSTGTYSMEEVGHKGYNLLKLIQLGYPVPPFCLVNSRIKKIPSIGKMRIMNKALEVLEALTGRKFNDPDNPLVFSLRSCQPENLPGLLPSYLNLGATEAAMPGLVKRYGEEGAYDLRISNATTLIMDSDPGRYGRVLRELMRPLPRNLAEKRKLLESLKSIMESSPFVTFSKPGSHLPHFANRIVRFCHDNKDLLHSFMETPRTYPIMILQEMILGNLEKSFSGVFHSREPCAGEGSELIIAHRAFGGEIMTGGMEPETRVLTDKKAILPISKGLYKTYDALMHLEEEFRSPITVEIAEERGCLAVLQANEMALSGPAMLRVAVEMHRQGKVERKDLLRLIQPYHLRQLFSDSVVVPEDLRPVASGISVLPRGILCAKASFSKDRALTAKASGEDVILIRDQFTPADVEVMVEMNGLICVSPAAVHVTEIARRYGIVALVGIHRGNRVPSIEDDRLVMRGRSGFVASEGDYVIMSSEKGELFLGKAETRPSTLAMFLMGIGELAEEEVALWDDLVTYVQEVEKISIEEVEEVELLFNLTSTLSFMRSKDRAIDFANRWFARHTEEFVRFFLNTRIGKHKGRIILFNLLDEANEEKLIRLIARGLSDSGEEGVFILGALLDDLEARRGKQAYSDFTDRFSAAERKILEEERTRTRRYLEISKIPPKARLTKKRSSVPRDVFLECLKFYFGEEETKKLTPDQTEQLRAIWDLEPDPTHKPHKTIRAALSKLGITR